jgi:pimeloyl-ACP methyl ester carboxylesterase
VALALAARRPELVDRLVVIGTPAPHEQIPWMPSERHLALESVRDESASAARSVIARQLAPLLEGRDGGNERLGLLGARAADDAALATPGTRERLDRMLASAFAQGATGMADDIAGYSLQPWGFEPAEVQAKTLLLYGARDPIAAAKHGTWWQKQLPDARLEMTPSAGHLLIVPRWQRALSHLAPGLKRRG